MILRNKFKKSLEILKKSFLSWKEDNATDLAAALSYYALFALAPTLLIILTLIGSFYGNQAIQADLNNQIQKNFDSNTAQNLNQIIQSLQNKQSQGLTRFFGLVILLFAGIGLIDFVHRALNSIWKVKLPKMSFRKWILSRLKYISVILIFAFLWILSVYLGSLISQFANLPILNLFLETINTLIFLGVTVLFLVALLDILIEKSIAFKALFLGSVFTAILIFAGNMLINFYLKQSNPTSAYGAASSILLVIIWINYVSQIFFFGVEITKSLDSQNEFKNAENLQQKILKNGLEMKKEVDKTLKKLDEKVKSKKLEIE